MSEHASNVSPVAGALSIDLESELSQSRQHKPWQSGLFSKLLHKTDDLRLVLISLEPGARMKEHHADGTISIHGLQGDLCLHVEGQAYDVHAGQVLTIRAGLKHDVEARDDAAFLLTISWPSAAKLGAHRHEGYGAETLLDESSPTGTGG